MKRIYDVKDFKELYDYILSFNSEKDFEKYLKEEYKNNKKVIEKENYNKFKEVYTKYLRKEYGKKGVIKIIFYNYWWFFKYLVIIYHIITRKKSDIEYYKCNNIYKYILNKSNFLFCEKKNDKSYSVLIKSIYNNIDSLNDLYLHLADEESKYDLYCIIMARLTLNRKYYCEIYDINNFQYFDPDIVHCNDEVFVDVGSYIGDTIEVALKLFNNGFKKIIAYEPNPINYLTLCENIKKFNFKNIDVIKKGVSNKKSVVFMDNTDVGGGDSKIVDKSTIKKDKESSKISLVTLDEDIKEKVTFIKIDIEGEEYNALMGAKNHIMNDSAKIACCIYHRNDDLWKIFKYINTLNPNYKYYIRHYTYYWAETVLYCIPKE